MSHDSPPNKPKDNTTLTDTLNEARREMSDKQNTDLLPCPFCGGEADIRYNNISCYGRKCAVNPCLSIAEFQSANMPEGTYHEWDDPEAVRRAIKAWNTRQPPKGDL